MSFRLVPLLALAFTSQEALAFPIFSSSANEAFRSSEQMDLNANQFDGIAGLPGCSGSVIRYAKSSQAKAVVLTNGHCLGLQKPGTATLNKPYSSQANVWDKNGKTHRYQITSVIYSTMTDTDITLFELSVTYADLEAAGIHAYELDSAPARAGDEIHMVSGYFQSYQTCKIEGVVHELDEDQWKFFGAYKYQECNSIHGTSGSPLISAVTGRVVGINNTHNDNGERCTLDNPCEVDANGRVSVFHGKSYGQRTDQILTCLNARGEFDVAQAGCSLTH